MEFITQDLNNITADYQPGMCRIFLIPIGLLPAVETDAIGVFSWPIELPASSFGDNKVVAIGGGTDSYKCVESPKESKAGTYQELKITLDCNNPDPENLRTLKTLSKRPVQILILTNKHKSKLYGQSDRGLDLSFSVEMDNDDIKIEKISVSIAGQSEDVAPFTTFTL